MNYSAKSHHHNWQCCAFNVYAHVPNLLKNECKNANDEAKSETRPFGKPPGGKLNRCQILI